MTPSSKLSRNILLFLMLLALPLLACETLLGADEPEFEEAAEITVEPEPPSTTAVEELDVATQPPPTAEPETEVDEPPTEPTPTEPPEVEVTVTSEPTGPRGPLGMGRDNPYPTNEFVQAPNWDIQVLEVVRGDEAWEMSLEASEFNDPPPEGMEYLLVNIHATSTYADDEPHEITYFDFNVTGDRFIKYGTAFVVDPEPALNAELLTGGETEGWVTFPVGAGEGNLILIFDEWANFDVDNERFIALEEGASLTTPAGLDELEANDIGISRDNPAAIGETVITERWEVTLLETFRGDTAFDMIMEADEFNLQPDEGFEYILARVQARNINKEGELEWLDNSNFQVVGELSELYDSPYFTTPDPNLDWETYPGAVVEGWVALESTVGEGDLLMIFDSFYDYSDNSMRYFTLE